MWTRRRKIYNFRVMLQILCRQMTAQKKFLFSCGIVELTAVFLNLKATYMKYKLGYGVIPCKADYFVWENGLYAKLFYIIPIMLLLFMKDSKAVEGEQYLIRKYRRKGIWYEMVIRVAVISVLSAAFQMVCVLLYAMLDSADNMNWEQKRSVFWLLTDGKVCGQGTVGYGQVILYFFILESFTCFITGIIYLLCDIFSGNRILSWFICLSMIIVDQGADIPIFLYGRISLDYYNWLNSNFNRLVVVSGLIGGIGIVLGKYLIERKEYYGDKSFSETFKV